MTMVYFAHPIDQAGPVHRIAMQGVKRHLRSSFDWVYDPEGAFSTDEAPFDARVQNINHEALLECDAVFALLPEGVGTVGTVHEIIFAAEARKPTTVYTPKRPVGLGDLGDTVDFFLSDPIPANRHEDLEKAITSLAQRAQAANIAPIFLLATETHRNAVPGLDNGGLFHYYGPMSAERKYWGDAAWDVAASHKAYFEPRERKRVRTGVYIAPPEDVWVSMVGRSSMFTKGLFVEPGVIDSGWRGELEVKVYNMTDHEVIIEAGERIAQLIPHRIEAQMLLPTEVTSLDQLPYGDRGTNGWGSTGK